MVCSWVAGFLVRFNFCRMVCIYGMGQAMAASSAEPERILRPRFRPETLAAGGHCQACLKACFLELDPRAEQLREGPPEAPGPAPGRRRQLPRLKPFGKPGFLAYVSVITSLYSERA